MIGQILWQGAVAGIIHFVALSILYGNPVIGRFYQQAQKKEPGVRKWPSQPKYLVTQFLGTQVEVYILTVAFLWLRPLVPESGVAGSVLLGLMFAAIRVYPRFWNMWIQSTYPSRLLKIELVNGTLGTLTIALTLHLLTN
jgi:hypothetical protein